MDFDDDPKERNILAKIAIFLFVAFLGGAGYLIHLSPSSPPLPRATFECQDVNGAQACVAVRDSGGSWRLVGLERDGDARSEDLDDGDLYPVVQDGRQALLAVVEVHHGKSHSYELDVPREAEVPVLMPDGSLAAAHGSGDTVDIAHARHVADMVDAARPETMGTAVAAADR